ncbi:MAG: elongation factor 4 [Candidatus Niyogibacteria bacterium]|nr:MAG: elongation factor 4 [Candidatus Niyogibacteria bacterium]
MQNIRNFVIIAHIDHGKSTLADRFLELTGTIEKRKMREQFLDSMELERERGITIKMQPVRMNYQLSTINYQLNLIDTPGHVDFAYEVSRALAAVEGAILLVDGTQGVEAQTISVLDMARELKLKIVPVVNKIDLAGARVEKTEEEIQKILNVGTEEILKVSGKTGEGVEELLKEVVERVPAPSGNVESPRRALIFDFDYSAHQGVIAYIRVFDGIFKKGDEVKLVRSGIKFTIQEIGVFKPNRSQAAELQAGEIGYIATNIKNPSEVRVGDTLTSVLNPAPALGGYHEPQSVVWTSVYPLKEDDFSDFKKAILRLHLSDTSFSYEEESSSVLGRGMRLGFLGMLHLEIVLERLEREFGMKVVAASPTVAYEISMKNGETKFIFAPSEFPNDHDILSVKERWADCRLIVPSEYLSPSLKLIQSREGSVLSTDIFGENRILIQAEMPLRELMRDFFDELKSSTSGYASFSYKPGDLREADVARLDILVHGSIVPAFSRVVSRSRIERESKDAVEKLYSILPRELFAMKLQAQSLGRIIASRTLPALKKDVTGYLYGGDRTRKMKLWSKQKKGKKRLKEFGRVQIPHEVFIKMIRRN